jgi:hypothetical protein
MITIFQLDFGLSAENKGLRQLSLDYFFLWKLINRNGEGKFKFYDIFCFASLKKKYCSFSIVQAVSTSSSYSDSYPFPRCSKTVYIYLFKVQLDPGNRHIYNQCKEKNLCHLIDSYALTLRPKTK